MTVGTSREVASRGCLWATSRWGACLAWLLILLGAATARAEEGLAALDRSPLLDSAVFQRLVSHPHHHIRFAESGAASSNVDADLAGSGPWFIEAQRYGADLVEAGLVCGSPETAALGWRVIDWGFDRQAADGGFAGTGDPFHSTSFFVESVARALLLTEDVTPSDAVAKREHYAPKLAAAAAWMRRDDVLRRGLANNTPYTHRRWLVAAAWGLTARVTHDEPLAHAAAESARAGLALQRSDGVNPEKNGFDVSYQALGLLMAERYLMVCDDPELRRAIEGMLDRGIAWELTKIRDDGSVDTGGSTRVTTETGRSGAAKTVDNKAIVLALTYAGRQLGRDDCLQAATTVARHLRWIK